MTLFMKERLDAWNHIVLSGMYSNAPASRLVLYLGDVTQLLQGLAITSVATNFLKILLNKRQTVSTVENIPD